MRYKFFEGNPGTVLWAATAVLLGGNYELERRRVGSNGDECGCERRQCNTVVGGYEAHDV